MDDIGGIGLQANLGKESAMLILDNMRCLIADNSGNRQVIHAHLRGPDGCPRTCNPTRVNPSTTKEQAE